jgi:type I restriction enzyme R subunit
VFFNPYLPVRKHLNHLPHWQQDSVFVFVTWRLADSVPLGVMTRWRDDRDSWISAHPKPWDEVTELEYHRIFSTQLEDWMDQGMGSCTLSNPDYARIVADSLLFFDGDRYFIDSFVVMPNHVHVLMRLQTGFSLEKVVQSWKQFSARQINQRQEKSGSFWHKRYWDRLVRSEDHFWKIRRYILRNPEKAKLHERQFFIYAPWNH